MKKWVTNRRREKRNVAILVLSPNCLLELSILCEKQDSVLKLLKFIFIWQ